MVVCNEEFNKDTDCFVNLGAMSLDFHSFFHWCAARCDESATIDLDNA